MLWDCLPGPSNGGLFFDVEEDKNHPGHYRTLLDLIATVDTLKIKPDGMFKEVVRCKEKNCKCSFKSAEDGRRHLRLCHDIVSAANPLGNVCKWKIDGVVCGQSFEKYWDLTKHKRKEGHMKSKVTQKKRQRGS